MAKYDWEKLVIVIFLDQDHSVDEPPEYDSYYEAPYADEIEEER
jgi:hypothetical protein